MNDGSRSEDSASGDGSGPTEQYRKKDFWIQENLKYVKPHFRLEKSARIVNKIAQGRECDLLDVGCGPATLMHLVDRNVHYYGMDIAIHNPAPNLVELDFVDVPIKFDDRHFDIVVAQGVFEYTGNVQSQKFAEIADLLTKDGIFIVSFVNFSHRKREIYGPYNNIQSFADFRQSLTQYFKIDRFFPTSHNWNHSEPGRKFMKAAQMRMNINIPIISPALAVEYFVICSPRGSK
ncbi:MAG: class I SAM-dependent methyltransferase [Actinomycetota bacterium]|nr:class I SAM-dependent methyltransferase [Actinomycetota bacterium]